MKLHHSKLMDICSQPVEYIQIWDMDAWIVANMFW